MMMIPGQDPDAVCGSPRPPAMHALPLPAHVVCGVSGQGVQSLVSSYVCAHVIAQWFANGQDQARSETWMAGTAECPTCRAVFCVHDVARVRHLHH